MLLKCSTSILKFSTLEQILKNWNRSVWTKHDFNHVCNIIISNNEKSFLKCKYTHKNKLRDLIPGYEVNLTRFSHDPNAVIFYFPSHVLTEHEKSLLCKRLRFSVPPKKIEYADFLTQFELLYRDTIMFEMKSKNCDLLKNKLKDIYLFLHFEIV